jgi:hypothetical protein
MAAGKTLMQAESEKRKRFTRVVSAIASLPVLGVGIGLLYVAYSEPDPVYLFLYAALGLIVTLFGFILLLQGMPTGGKKVVIRSETAKSGPDLPEKEAEAPATEVPENKCPHCGADIISAGKFCGNCGKPLE